MFEKFFLQLKSLRSGVGYTFFFVSVKKFFFISRRAFAECVF